MTDIEVRTGFDIPVTQLLELYDAVGWMAYTSEERRSELEKAVRNSTYVVSAWAGERLIGLARGLSDEVSIFYLQDILVHPHYQRQGIGERLMQACLERYRHVRAKVLLTDDEERQHRFYEKMGYKNTQDLSRVKLTTFIQIDGAA